MLGLMLLILLILLILILLLGLMLGLIYCHQSYCLPYIGDLSYHLLILELAKCNHMKMSIAKSLIGFLFTRHI